MYDQTNSGRIMFTFEYVGETDSSNVFLLLFQHCYLTKNIEVRLCMLDKRAPLVRV